MGIVGPAWRSETDWLATPAAIRFSILVRQAQLQVQRQELELLRNPITALASEQANLRRRIGRGLRNASQPPSRDGVGCKPAERRQGSGHKCGGQPGHPGSWLQRPPIERVDELAEHHPDDCRRWGTLLQGEDSDPLASSAA